MSLSYLVSIGVIIFAGLIIYYAKKIKSFDISENTENVEDAIESNEVSTRPLMDNVVEKEDSPYDPSKPSEKGKINNCDDMYPLW